MRVLFSLLCGLVLVACDTGSSRDEAELKSQFTILTTRDDFVSQIVGRNWQSDSVKVQIAADGTLTGDLNGVPATGVWEWQDNLFCSAFRIADSGGQDCSQIGIARDRMLVVPLRGTGAPFVYTEI